MHRGQLSERPLDDFLRHAGHGGGIVAKQALSLAGVEQFKQRPRLAVVVIAVAVVVAVGVAGDLQRHPLPV